jgi:pyruvate decarboxylase
MPPSRQQLSFCVANASRYCRSAASCGQPALRNRRSNSPSRSAARSQSWPRRKVSFPEDHRQFAGIYWGEVSTHQAQEIVDWSDAVLCIGAIFNDYSTVGWTAMPSGSILIADNERVYPDRHDFARVRLRDFLSELARKAEKREATMVEYKRIRSEPLLEPATALGTKLTRTEIMRQIQDLVTSDCTVFAETGDSWFNGIRLKLPAGARFEIEMQWGSIGWSVPAKFGYLVGARNRRIIAMIGDDSFQLTAQEVAQMIRRKVPVIIFLINNHGYNNIKNWDYAGLIQAFNAEDGRGLGMRVSNCGELAGALEAAIANHDGPTLIECIIDRGDCSPELISWGRLVARADARPPSP